MAGISPAGLAKTNGHSPTGVQSDEDNLDKKVENGEQDGDDGSGDDDEDDSDDSEEVETVRKPPLQLLVETVAALVRKEYETARKLCQMILLYEPTHPQASQLMSVIDEKLRLSAESAQEEGDGDEGSSDDGSTGDGDDDDDDDDDASDKSDDSSDSSSSGSSSEETSSDGEQNAPAVSVQKGRESRPSIDKAVRPLSN